MLLVLGGGVAGTTAAEAILEHAKLYDIPNPSVTLVSPAEHVSVGRALASSARAQEIRVHSIPGNEWARTTGVRFVRAIALELDVSNKVVKLENAPDLNYDLLCIATGASPVVPDAVRNAGDKVYVLRDESSIQNLRRDLRRAQDVLVLGNGGVALEIVDALRAVRVTWAYRNSHPGSAFFDSRSIRALIPAALVSRGGRTETAPVVSAGTSCTPQEEGIAVATTRSGHAPTGAAQGPFWDHLGDLVGCGAQESSEIKQIPDVQVVGVKTMDDGRLEVKLSSGQNVICDLIISGTGVAPRIEWLQKSGLKMAVGPSGSLGVAVSAGKLKTSNESVFAAGDCTTVVVDGNENMGRDWFQKYLWTQAWTAGLVAGRSMAAEMASKSEEADIGMEFELFAHSTRFLGVPVVFLGRYSAQGITREYKMLEAQGESEGPASQAGFVRVVLVDGRIRGALLVGSAVDRSETYENLILDQLQVEHLGAAMVDLDNDIADYFD